MKKNILGTAVLLAAILMSCQKDSSTSNNSTVLLQKMIVTNSNSKQTIIYSYDGNKLQKMTSAETGDYIMYTYQGDNIIRTETYDAKSKLVATSDYVYTNNNLTQQKSYRGTVLGAKWDYINNSDGTIDIAQTSYATNGTVSIFKNKLYYDSTGNLIKNEQLSSPLTTTVYEYDSKYSPTSNVLSYNKLPYASTKNKMKSTIKTGVSTIIETFSYQYNSQDYPISCQSTSPYGNTTITYSY